MEQYKQEFIEFMVESNVLRFGDFITKSGRKTPFFINTGNYTTGEQLDKLGMFYAKAINEHFGKEVDVLFGPAYKGIPLTVTTAISMNKLYDFVVDSPLKVMARRVGAKHREMLSSAYGYVTAWFM